MRFDLSLLLCLLSVPIVQVFGISILGRSISSGKRILKVLRFGGIRHLVLTIVSWLLWGISLLFATPVIHPSLMAIHPTHIQVLHGAAIAISVMSLILNIKAVFFFKSPKKTKRSSKFQGNKLLQRWIRPEIGFVIVLLLGLILSVMSAVFVAMMDSLPDMPSKLLYCSISVACSLIAASTTHGLGGLLRHGQDGHKKEGSWRFFQPFVGGRVFIATQALGWSLFSLSLVCFIALVREIVKGVAIALKMWALASGGTAVVTQIVLGLSVFYFKPGNKEKWMFHLKRFILENLPVVLMYIPIHAICTIWVFTFTFLPMTYALLMWTLILSVYYVSTTKGHPSKTGCRKWPAFQAFIAKHIEASLKRWFGRIEVINAAGKKLDPEEKYIYGYHPHGMYPVGAGFLRILPQFREMVCEHIPTVLCATALFIPPLLRDIMCWNGIRDVSRSTFVKTLTEEKSVLLCPGGQEELVETYRSSGKKKEIVLCSRHKGFCRLAIEQQAALVPVLSLGEIFTLQNAFNIPFLQTLTYKWIGFPIPYLLVGRWGFSPLPKKVPLLYVVGEPIQPPKITLDDPNFEEELNKLHQKFFGSLVDLFHKHKDEHPLYEDAEVVIKT